MFILDKYILIYLLISYFLFIISLQQLKNTSEFYLSLHNPLIIKDKISRIKIVYSITKYFDI